MQDDAAARLAALEAQQERFLELMERLVPALERLAPAPTAPLRAPLRLVR